MEWISRKVAQYILGAAIMAMGILGYWSDLVPNPKLFLGLFLIYGAWRVYRAYKI